jgi:hypothetical protein
VSRYQLNGLLSKNHHIKPGVKEREGDAFHALFNRLNRVKKTMCFVPVKKFEFCEVPDAF